MKSFIILFALQFGTMMLCAQETPSLKHPVAVALNAEIIVGETVGDNQIHRVHFSYSTNEFLTILPADVVTDLSSSEQIAIANEKSGYYITIRLLRRPDSGQAPVGETEAASLALERFPGLQITETNGLSLMGNSGPQIIGWHELTAGSQSCRVEIAFVPCRIGVWEITKVCNGNEHSCEAAANTLNFLLLDFRSNENGELEVVPQPSQS